MCLGKAKGMSRVASFGWTLQSWTCQSLELNSVTSLLGALGQMTEVLILSVFICNIEVIPYFGVLLCGFIEIMYVKGIVRCLK